MVVTYLMARSPEVAAAMRHLLIVHHGGDCTLCVPGAVGRGVHIRAGSTEHVPDIVINAFKVFDAHIAILVRTDGVPHVH